MTDDEISKVLEYFSDRLAVARAERKRKADVLVWRGHFHADKDA